MHVLVTGGASSISSNFVLHTLAIRPDVNVAALDASTYAVSPASLEGANCEVIRGDVRNAELIDCLMLRFDAAVHFVVGSHNDNSLVDANPFVITSILGIVNLAKTCAIYKACLHYISTDEVSGNLALDNPAHFTTAAAYKPSSPHSAPRAPTDHFVRAWVHSFGLATTISDYSNDYGPRQHPKKLVPRQIHGLPRERGSRAYGTGENVRDWVYVDNRSDVVRAILDAGEVGETYLTGADDRRSNLDVVGDILEGPGHARSDFVHTTDHLRHDRRYAIDPAPIRTLGWQPCYQNFSSDFAETIDWYRAGESWWIAAYDAAEASYAEREQELQS